MYIMDQLTGSEPHYDETYNTNELIENHNCYDYAIGHINPDQPKKSQPGRTVLGNKFQGNQVYSCKYMEDRILSLIHI